MQSSSGDSRTLLTSKEIQDRLLRILIAFSQYCDSHGLTYSLVGGTMLGAARHQGFIPWDDDIDVGMPRPDYERLIASAKDFEAETGLRLSGYRHLGLDATPMLKVEDPEVAVMELYRYPTDLWIDLLPVDGLPANERLSALQCRTAGALRRVLSISLTPRTFRSGALGGFVKDRIVQPLTARYPQIPRGLGRALTWVSTRVPFGSTGWAGIISWGMYFERERVAATSWQKLETATFEGRSFAALSDWDAYLSSLYGDYMQLPPEDKRESHDIEAWVKEDK